MRGHWHVSLDEYELTEEEEAAGENHLAVTLVFRTTLDIEQRCAANAMTALVLAAGSELAYNLMQEPVLPVIVTVDPGVRERENGLEMIVRLDVLDDDAHSTIEDMAASYCRHLNDVPQHHMITELPPPVQEALAEEEDTQPVIPFTMRAPRGVN